MDKTRGAVGFSSAKAAALAEILLPAFCLLPTSAGFGLPGPPSPGPGFLPCLFFEVSTQLLPQANLFLLSRTWIEDRIKSTSQHHPQPGPPNHAVLKIGSSDLKDTGLFLRCFKKEERSPLLPLSPLQSFLLFPSVGKSCKGTATELDK